MLTAKSVEAYHQIWEELQLQKKTHCLMPGPKNHQVLEGGKRNRPAGKLAKKKMNTNMLLKSWQTFFSPASAKSKVAAVEAGGFGGLHKAR